ncbi:MAG: ComF family protein [Candidatus Staskawiczbacteria bacterium]|nr:ComF family protein [Candidatus Staskawiczbacteria bacterium]
MDNSKDFLLDLFFPKFCLGCQKEGTYLCDDCRALLDISEHNYCLCDTKPQRLPVGKQGKCQRCQNKTLSGLYFALSYKEKTLTRKLIYEFKYKPYLKDLAKTLASILIEHFVLSEKNTDEIWAPNGVPAILIPVPLDKSKLKIRGYNQSEELAEELSKVLHIPTLSDVLTKIKPTASQMELSKLEREMNLENVFLIKKPEKISGKNIFLVDDVYTTGSTMQECAKVLKENGAKSVWGICIAREG